MADAHKNLAIGTVATAPSPATSGTTVVMTTGHAARFPAVPFFATIWPTGTIPDPANAEIVRVTALATETFTITRAQKSTTARTVIVGDLFCAGIYAEDLTDELDLTTEWTSTVPVTPVTGVTIFMRRRGGGTAVGLVQSNGQTLEMQPHFGERNVMVWLAQPGGVGSTSFGMTTPTIQGTATVRVIALTNFSTAWKKVAYVSAATAAAVCEIRGPTNVCGISSTAGLGGFMFRAKFQPSDTVAGTTDRFFCGLIATAAGTNVDPSSLLSFVGVGFDGADTQLQMMCNDGAGVATKVALGTNFLKATTTNIYEVRMSCDPGSTVVTWSIERLDTSGTLQEGTFDAANRPASGTLLAPKIYKTNNAVAAVTAFCYQSVYCSTEQ